jgi:hypothetical protein
MHPPSALHCLGNERVFGFLEVGHRWRRWEPTLNLSRESGQEGTWQCNAARSVAGQTLMNVWG